MSHTKDYLMKLEAEAQALGWADLDQMLYYEQMAAEEYLRTVQQLPSPPPSIFVPHELDKVDSREVYNTECEGYENDCCCSPCFAKYVEESVEESNARLKAAGFYET